MIVVVIIVSIIILLTYGAYCVHGSPRGVYFISAGIREFSPYNDNEGLINLYYRMERNTDRVARHTYRGGETRVMGKYWYTIKTGNILLEHTLKSKFKLFWCRRMLSAYMYERFTHPIFTKSIRVNQIFFTIVHSQSYPLIGAFVLVREFSLSLLSATRHFFRFYL